MVDIPSPDEFQRGCLAYQQHEKRDAMYKVATFLVNHFWGNPDELADSVGVLLLTWNSAFYNRFGGFDFDLLEACIRKTFQMICKFHEMNILNYSSLDDKEINYLFLNYLSALEIADGRSSPVGVAKTLHMLAPAYFPIWDREIAKVYHCSYDYSPITKYIKFIQLNKKIAEALSNVIDIQKSNKTLLKLIDEYNYAKYTKKWV